MTGVQVRVIEDPHELEGLASTWRHVLAGSQTRSPFMTHAFVRHWWACFGRGQGLRVMLVEDAEGPCAIAPLARARRALGPIVYRSLELIGTGAIWSVGTGLADRADLLLARRSEECVDAIFRSIRKARDWDVLDLRGVPATSTAALVLDAHARADADVIREPRWRSPYLRLPASFDLYLTARGKNFRRALRRKLLRMEARGAVTIDLDAGAHDPIAALARAADVCRRSWKGRHGTSLLLHPQIRRFLERLTSDPGSGAFVAELRVGETTVAYELGFRLDGKVWSYDSAYDLAFSDGSPGVLLTARIIEDACRRGMSEYDFMRGDEPYKLAWTDTYRQEMEYVLDAGTLRARLAREVAFQARWWLRRSSALVACKTRATGAMARLLERVRTRAR
jgi:CelD/BcsL family acetyltransferase involved in cellulose biosynthesis